MENDSFFANSGHLQPVSEMNCAQSSQQLLQTCCLNLNWDQSVDQRSHFGSDLGSMVSSPSTRTPPANVVLRGNVILGELVGKIGSICSSDEISPQPHLFLGGGCGNICNTTTTAALNSSPKLNLSIHNNNQPVSGTSSVPPTNHLTPLAMDPGFTERAARFSSFNEENYGGSQVGVPDISIQDRSQLGMKTLSEFGSVSTRCGTTNDGQFRCGVEVPLIISANRGKSRKFKVPHRGRTKDAPFSSIRKHAPKVAAKENFNMKRTKSSESAETAKDDLKPKVEFTSSANSGVGDQKPTTQPEPPKQDYIHVRARRGQATDSHSLAERVRREKISERMKFLQDLVPGCNKVTGKAVMLDEIINYVQSLQRQVEFMSMKLATVNPRLDFNIENLPHKDVPQLGLSCEASESVFPFTPQNVHFQSILMNGIENSSTMPSFDGLFGTDFPSQVGGAFWDDDLQTVVQMGFSPNQ